MKKNCARVAPKSREQGCVGGGEVKYRDGFTQQLTPELSPAGEAGGG